MLTQARLKELLDYDPETGVFTRRKWGTGPTGTVNRNGYVRISVKSRAYSAHRLAFLYMEGFMPPSDVDHINGVRSDNRWVNLRKASRSQNTSNRASRGNKTGQRGVSECSPDRYAAAIRARGKKDHLGIFATAELAHLAWCKAAFLYRGEFARFD